NQLKANCNNMSTSCTITDGTPWLQAKEVATILAYTNTKNSIIGHVDDADNKRREELRADCESTLDYNDRRTV
ncbi:MAG: Bro-N domain-containing protein, partial [Candidatus Fonsibacter sp.]